jgi:hypothetical protein
MRLCNRYLIALSAAAVLLVSGCGSSNQFGGSFDIVQVCADASCGDGVSNPEASLSANEPVQVWFEFVNRLTYDDEGQTVRLRKVQVEYKPPFGPHLPNRVEQITFNIPPDDTEAIYPVTIFSYEQLEWVRDHFSEYPDRPFQVACKVKVFYDTTGGSVGDVERYISVQVTD